jgi:hypothetical protein
MRLPGSGNTDLERRLDRERPRPDRDYAQQTGAALNRVWLAAERPANVGLHALALVLAGAIVLIVALIVALS